MALEGEFDEAGPDAFVRLGKRLANRRFMMDAVGLAIAALLPADHRGAYGDDVADLDDARRLRCDLFG